MTNISLFGLPPSTYTRTALMVLEAKGVDYQLIPCDFRTAEYGARHPFHKVPALEHGEVRLFEALAIASYVDEAFEGPSLQPETAAGRAEMLQWISAINDYVYDIAVGQCIAERFVKPMRGLTADEDVIAAALPAIAKILAVFERKLASTPYLAGDQVTLADMFLAPITRYLSATPEGHDLFAGNSALVSWQERVSAMPGYARINALG